MLERETDLIIKTIAARTIGNADALRLGEFLDADIPAGVKVYTYADVAGRLERELWGAPAFGRIDLDKPSTARLARASLRSLALSYVFPKADLLVAVDNAVHFLENYLCRPQWTLENFIFEQNSAVPAQLLLSKLDYLVEYAYFKKVIARYVTQNGVSELRAGEFRDLVSKIDDQVVKQHNARELAMLIKPLYDFLLLCPAPFDTPIPLKPILVFFDDKKMKVLHDYIEDICGIRKRSEISLNELTGMIEALYLGVSGEEAEPAGPEEPPQEPDQPQAPPEPPPSPTPQPGGMNIALSLTFAGMQESQHALPDLNALIPEEQRGRFIRKIFMKDEDYYAGIIAALNNFRTWKDATQYLSQLFEINGLDPFAEEVVEFTDVIQRRYQAADG